MSELVIPKDANINGHVENQGDIFVDGRVTGSLTTPHRITISPQASCRADVRCNDAIVRGEVVGDISCGRTIEVAAGARVVGDLRAPSVTVSSDAEVDGKVSLLEPQARSIEKTQFPVTVRNRDGNFATIRRIPRPPRPSTSPVTP